MVGYNLLEIGIRQHFETSVLISVFQIFVVHQFHLPIFFLLLQILYRYNQEVYCSLLKLNLHKLLQLL